MSELKFKFLRIILLIIWPSFVAFGQQDYIDSLDDLLKHDLSPHAKMDIYYKLAKSYRNQNPYIGLDYADSCYQISRQIGDAYMEAGIINEIGVLYRKVDMYEIAIDYHHSALSMFEKLDDNMGIAYSLANIGNVFLILGQLEKALDYNLKSLDMKKEIGDPFQIAYSYRTSGLVYQALKSYDSAVVYFNKAMDIYQDIKDPYNLANIYYHLGNVYLESGKKQDMALFYYSKAQKKFNDLQNSYGTALANYEAGKAHLMLKQYQKAKLLFDDALRMARKSNTRKIVMDIYYDYSQLYKETGKFEIALGYFTKYSELRDSLLSETTSKNIAEMQVKYRSDKQEAEISLLRKENQLISNEQKLQSAYLYLLIVGILAVSTLGMLLYSRYHHKKKTNRLLEEEIKIQAENERKLQASKKELMQVNATKDKFFSIISHDLKGPFGAMMGLSELLEADYDVMIDSERKELIGEISKSTKNTYLLLLNLLAWSQSQRGTIDFEPAIYSLKKICDENIGFISAEARKKKIDITCELAEGIKVFADYNMLTTIIRNLLSNAVKFSNPGSSVSISAQHIKAHNNNSGSPLTRILVSDNGVGIDKNDLTKLFKIEKKHNTRGTANETGTGLGLVLCKEFVMKHGGEITVDSSKGQGSTFAFTLPFKI